MNYNYFLVYNTDFASDFEIKLLDYTLDKIYPCGWDMHRYSKG